MHPAVQAFYSEFKALGEYRKNFIKLKCDRNSTDIVREHRFLKLRENALQVFRQTVPELELNISRPPQICTSCPQENKCYTCRFLTPHHHKILQELRMTRDQKALLLSSSDLCSVSDLDERMSVSHAWIQHQKSEASNT